MDANLERHWPALGLRPDAAVLVPLCGKSLDLLWLRARGHPIVGVELSDIALESFLAEHGVPARRRALACFDRYEAPGFELYRGDVFALTPPLLGNVAAVYDRAALVSWSPAARDAYAACITGLTAPGTLTLLIALEYAQQQMSGPPFAVDATEVARLYGRSHAIREIERRDVTADEPRMQARGVSQVFEVCYQLTRL